MTDDEIDAMTDDEFWAHMLGDDDPCAPGKDWAADAYLAIVPVPDGGWAEASDSAAEQMIYRYTQCRAEGGRRNRATCVRLFWELPEIPCPCDDRLRPSS